MTWKGEKHKHALCAKGLKIYPSGDAIYKFNSGSAISTDSLTILASNKTLDENKFIDYIKKHLAQYKENLNEEDIKFLREFYKETIKINRVKQ